LVARVEMINNLDWIERYKPEKRLIQGKAYLRIKRVLDLVLSLLAAPAWLSLIVLIWVLIKLDSPGDPAFFVQQRTGKNGMRFGMYKFRTMVSNAEELKERYAYLNELPWPDFKITNDPRITRVGKFLRKTSMDELPQFVNVLKGDMSLVGPRPTSFSVETYSLWHTERLEVSPGLTGLWQIVGRGAAAFDDRLRMDIAYIERRCLTLDFEIMIRTCLAVLEERGAH
jgi:lipopolysaccharide/colanic/teichoic acid biosynthesis glycosyltransferase